MYMGVEARCPPSKSAAHCRHMKRQPFLHGCPCHGCLLCHRRHHLQLRLCRCRHHRCRCNCPLLLPLPWAIAAVAVNHCRGHLCCVAVSHRYCRCPCRRILPSPSCHRPSLLPCRWPFPRIVALAWQKLYSTNQSKECLPYFILLG